MSTDGPPIWSDHERWNVLMENVKDYGIFMLEATGLVVSWNVGAERMFGYSSAEIIGQPFSRIFTSHDLGKQQPEFELREAREKGRSEDERWHVRKDGTQFWASGVVTPLWDDKGQLRGFAKIVRDITERKQTELAMADANRRKDEFLAMLSHELRNPLGAILSSLELVKQEVLPEGPAREGLQIIERQAQLVVHMVNDLLDVSRIAKGSIQLCRQRTELQTLVNNAVQTIRPLIEARNHELTIEMPSEAIWLDVDPNRIEQALANLLNNAAKYTDPGGKIDVTVNRQGNDVLVRIADNGSGIVSDMLPRIFDLFVQADRSLDRSQGGLGIGLTLVKRLVEIHGGSVEAASPGAGLGSTFTIRMPVVGEVASLAPEEAIEVEPATAVPLRILVVDDSEDTAQGIAMLLRKYGHEVRIAHSGSEALRIANEQQSDAVLLDIGLPGMDGYRVAEHLRGEGGLKNVQLIAMTGYGQEEDLEKSKQAGFDHHLVKPIKFADLLKLLTRSS